MPLDSTEYRAMVDAVAQGVEQGMQEAARTGGFASGGSLRGARGDRIDPKARAAQEKQRKVLADQSKTYQELVKQLKQNEISSDQLREAVKTGNVVFDRAVEQGFKTSKMFGTLGGSLDKLPKAFSYAIRTSGSDMASELAGSVASLEEVFIAQQKFADLPEVADLMDEFAKGKMRFVEMKDRIIKLGFSASDAEHMLDGFGEGITDSNGILKKTDAARKNAGQTIGKFRKEVLKTQKSLATLGKGQKSNLGPLAAAKDKLEDMTILGFSVGKAFAAISAAALGYLKVLTDTTSSAMKFGTSLQMWDAAMMGMQMGELGELQSQYRNTILASGKGFEAFNDQIMDANDILFEYSGNLADTTRTSAHILDANLRLGGSAETASKFMDDQTAMLHIFNRVLGMTTEQFREMNNEIINSVDVRASLFKLDKGQRAQRFLDIQQSIEGYRMGGMAIDQAKQLAMHFEKLRGEDPMDRIKRAFRTRALMGAVGVSGGAEVGRAIIAGPRATAEQRAAEQGGALRTQQAIQGMQGTLGGELMSAMMVGKLGLGETFGAKGAMVDPILEVGREAHEDSAALLDKTKIIADGSIVSNDLLKTGLMFQAQAGEVLKTGGLAAAGFGAELIGKLTAMGLAEGPRAIAGTTAAASAGTLGAMDDTARFQDREYIKEQKALGTAALQKWREKQAKENSSAAKEASNERKRIAAVIGELVEVQQRKARERPTAVKSSTGSQVM